jgi:hypothetical protein
MSRRSAVARFTKGISPKHCTSPARRVGLLAECPIFANTGSAWALEIVMSTVVEQNTLKRRSVGLRACDHERACPGFTLFAPLFEQNRTVYLIDLKGDVVVWLDNLW